MQKRVDQYDTRLVNQAKQQQAVLASQRVAFDLEKQKQADFYEARIKELETARARDVARAQAPEGRARELPHFPLQPDLR